MVYGFIGLFMINKEKKQEIINNLADKLSRQKTVIFLDHTGLKVNQVQQLRQELREKEIDYQAAKKTLINLALQKIGFKDIFIKDLSGQIALVFGYQDEILPAKIIYNFSKGNEALKILAGLVKGEYLEKEAIIDLAKLPSKEELLVQLVNIIWSPIGGLINALEGNLNNLVGLLEVIKNNKSSLES